MVCILANASFDSASLRVHGGIRGGGTGDRMGSRPALSAGVWPPLLNFEFC